MTDSRRPAPASPSTSTPADPVRAEPGLIMGGHAAVLAGVVVLAVLLTRDGLAANTATVRAAVAAGRELPWPNPFLIYLLGLFALSLGVLAYAQIRAIRVVRAGRRVESTVGVRPDADPRVVLTRRSLLPALLAGAPVLTTPAVVGLVTVRPGLVALILVLVAVSMLLGLGHVAWVWRRTSPD